MSLDTRNAELEEKLEHNPIDENIQTLIRADKRRKAQVTLLAISIFIELLLSVALAYGWSQNHKLAIQAESNHMAILRNCETSNEARANNKQLWDYLLTQTPSQPPTAEQEKRIADFEAFVNKTFAPRDCSSLK